MKYTTICSRCHDITTYKTEYAASLHPDICTVCANHPEIPFVRASANAPYIVPCPSCGKPKKYNSTKIMFNCWDRTCHRCRATRTIVDESLLGISYSGGKWQQSCVKCGKVRYYDTRHCAMSCVRRSDRCPECNIIADSIPRRKSFLSLPGEKWKRIPEYDYSFSNLGRCRNDKSFKILRILHMSQLRYPSYFLYKNKKKYVHYVHALLGELFIKIPKRLQGKKIEIAHNNHNVNDYSIKNLHWATRKQNIQESIQADRYPNRFKQKDIKKVIQLWQSGKYTKSEIGRMFDKDYKVIHDIIRKPHNYGK